MQTSAPLATARHELLAELIEGSGVTTAVPQPGVAAYIAYAASRLIDTIEDWLSPLGHYAGRVGNVLAWTAATLVAVLVILLLAALVRYASQRLRASSSKDDGADIVPEPEPSRRERDRDEWRREFEIRLARSDVHGALEATWWWLARAVLGESVRSSWTSGELLSRSGRPSLREPLRTLERSMYGGGSPSIDDVRALARSLEEALT